MQQTPDRNDEFIRSILGDDAPLVSSPRMPQSPKNNEVDTPSRIGYGAPTTHDPSAAALSKERFTNTAGGTNGDSPQQRQANNNNLMDYSSEEDGLRTHRLFRYALLFINFTFVVAALLMIMAGVVAGFNSALQLCNACGKLTIASIVLGGVQWLMALFAFNWIRQRNILFLLGYVAVVLVITVGLFTIFVASIAYGVQLNSGTRAKDLLAAWEADVNSTDVSTGQSVLCALQIQYNCSGFHYGCCLPSCTNVTPAPDWWKALVCPPCGTVPVSHLVCTTDITTSAVQNIGGFIVITFLAIVLTITGMFLAAFSRQMSR